MKIIPAAFKLQEAAPPPPVGEVLWTIDSPDEINDATFGYRAVYSKDHIIVRSFTQDKVFIYNRVSTDLIKTITLSAEFSSGFGLATTDTHFMVGVSLEGAEEARLYEITTGNLVTTILNPNHYGTATDDYFGWSVDLTDTHAIVGAYREDDVNFSSTGIAYVFDLPSGSLLYTVENPAPATNDYFGYAVSINDAYFSVGAYGLATGGSTYLYSILDGVIDHTFTSPNYPGTFNRFGEAVVISDNKIMIGSPGARESAPYGGVYIYDLATLNLIHDEYNPGNGEYNAGRYGLHIDLTDTHFAVGIPDAASVDGTNSGRVFIHDSTTGDLVFELVNPNPFGTKAWDEFGKTVSLTSDRVLSGAPGENHGSSVNVGKVYLYAI